jgi:hypothetical protein
MRLYHHTDTAHLPWILTTNELRPGRSSIGGFPNPDFLWATTDAQGDRTSMAGHSRELYRRGVICAVRFTLAADEARPAKPIGLRLASVSFRGTWADGSGSLDRANDGEHKPALKLSSLNSDHSGDFLFGNGNDGRDFHGNPFDANVSESTKPGQLQRPNSR